MAQKRFRPAFSITLDPKLLAALDKRAKRLKLKRSRAVEQALRAYLASAA